MKKISPIKKLRLLLAMNMHTFGASIKVSESAICLFEANKRLPRVRTAYRILDLAKKHSYPMTLDDIYPRPSAKSKTAT